MSRPLSRWLAPVIAAVVLAAAPAMAATRFVLAVGNNVGAESDGALRWAERDARRVAELMRELGQVASGRAILLQGASAELIRSALVRLHGQVEEARRHGTRTEIFVFYSGHGDSTALHIGEEEIPLDELRSRIRSIPADSAVTILDACRAGALRSGRAKGAVHGPAFDISLAREPGPAGQVIISSAGNDEIAQESDELRGSFFTHHLLSGLRGAADTDADGRVTLAELYRYAYHHTLASSHGETSAVQHPEMELRLEGEGEIVMSYLQRSSSSLVLPRGLDGDFLIVDDRNGHVLAEVRKPGSESRRIALPAGRYRIQLRHASRIWAGEVALDWGGAQTLRASDLREQPRLAALAKGSHLDPSPWSVQVAAVAASPTALGEGIGLGGHAGLERMLGEHFLLRADLLVSHARASNEVWRYAHLDLRLTASAGYAIFAGPLRLSAGLGAGLLVVREEAERIDAERISAVSDAATRSASSSVGPSAVLGVEIRLALVDAWILVLGGDMHLACLPISGSWQTRLAGSGLLGVGYVF
ncbi:MAG: caspase family protein [Deltaproteobacteria bacterium]|nr:caspase family protein [Deltaproteobacteria bacterium]